MTDREMLVELARAVVAADVHCKEMVRANKTASYILGHEYGRTERAQKARRSILDGRPNSSDYTLKSLMDMEPEEESLPAEEVSKERDKESQEWDNEGGQ